MCGCSGSLTSTFGVSPAIRNDRCVPSAVVSETTKSSRRSIVPAVTHVDYSARVQTVDEQRHGRFYRLLRRFHEKTGCPVMINTSFNIRGEPIVCTPQDAYRCFLATNMDVLVLEDFVLRKERQPRVAQDEVRKYTSEFALD